MRKITEKDELHKRWYVEAKEQTLETFPKFLKKLSKAYNHDYGTICHAVAAAALGAANSINHSSQGGITGFQSGAVMWEFIQEWQHLRGRPLRLVDYHDMLYPQYRNEFTTISNSTWKWLKREARKNLLEHGTERVSGKVVKHWRSIVNGKIPFGLKVRGDDN